MTVEQLVQQPCREHLTLLHPLAIRGTTWFTKSHNGITKSINQMTYSLLKNGYPTYSKFPDPERERWFCQFAQEFNWESGHTETVRLAFHEKIQIIYGKQIYGWKQLWRKGKTPKMINETVWLELQEHWTKPESEDKSSTNF
ncbi:hypothetical protein N665_0288s0016, partial [Sinapis alba]